MLLKLNTAFNRTFSFVGVSITSLSVTISKDGAAFGAIAGTLTQITGNYYKLTLAVGDTDTAGSLCYKFNDTVLNAVVPNGEDVDQVGAPDVTLADGVAHCQNVPGSSTATMFLQQVNVTAVSGDAVHIEGASGGIGAYLLGGIAGLALNGMTNGNALQLEGGTSSGYALYTPGGYGGFNIVATGNGQPGINIAGAANAPGINALGGVNGAGMVLSSGGGDAQGLLLAGSGSGHDLELTGSHSILGYIAGNASPTFIGPGIQLDPAQAIDTSNTANTVGDCLNAARADGFGPWALNASTRHWQIFAGDGTTVVHEFIVDSVTEPLTRVDV